MKLKTLSSAKKRVRVTGTGKVLVNKTGKRHLLSQKSKKAKGRNSYGVELSPVHNKAILASIPYCGK